MQVHLADLDGLLSTVVRTPKECIVQHLSHDRMDLLPWRRQLTSTLTALAILETGSVSAWIPTIDANQFVALGALCSLRGVLVALNALDEVK